MFSSRWAPTTRVRVLVTGESPTTATSQECLWEAGYDTQVVGGAMAALGALADSPFDLIIVEWELPDSTALRLC